MDNIQIAWLAEIAATNARIAGMQADNAQRAVEGLSPAYVGRDFESEAAGLYHIAEAARTR